MAENRDLPGMPKQKLVKDVRKWLRSFGIHAHSHSTLWLATWDWAAKIARSYVLRPQWPLPSEIAAQYVLLLLVEMHQARALKLPYRAAEQIPDHIRDRLAAGVPVIGLPARIGKLPDRTGGKS